jgi:hypothetical protein
LRVALASSLDFLQGTFEKIGLQRFVRYQPLQLGYLKPQFTLFGVLRRCLAVVNRLQLIAPFVQQPAMHAEFFCQRDNVVAPLQSLDRHLPECLRVSPRRSLFCHSQFLSLQGVPTASVSILGFSPCFRVAGKDPIGTERWIRRHDGLIFLLAAQGREATACDFSEGIAVQGNSRCALPTIAWRLIPSSYGYTMD